MFWGIGVRLGFRVQAGFGDVLAVDFGSSVLAFCSQALRILRVEH